MSNDPGTLTEPVEYKVPETPEEIIQELTTDTREAVEYLDRAVPVLLDIAEKIENGSVDAKVQLGSAEDGLKWLHLFTHKMLATPDGSISEDLRSEYKEYKEGLVATFSMMVSALEKGAEGDLDLTKAITDTLVPLLNRLREGALKAQKHFEQD